MVFENRWSLGLVHGDLWNNNVLFEKNTIDCKIVDWQFCSYKNTLLDLSGILCTSVAAELRKRKENEWVELYYNEIINLTKVSKNEYTYQQCMAEYQMSKLYTMVMMIASIDVFYFPSMKEDTDIKERYTSLISELESVMETLQFT